MKVVYKVMIVTITAKAAQLVMSTLPKVNHQLKVIAPVVSYKQVLVKIMDNGAQKQKVVNVKVVGVVLAVPLKPEVQKLMQSAFHPKKMFV